MDIQRITDQGPETLEQHYQESSLRSSAFGAKSAMRMLELLQHLRALEGPSIWAVTSHDNLGLHAGDNYLLPTLVGVTVYNMWFHIEYRMPATKAPWNEETYARGITTDVRRAGEMILFGLHEALQDPSTVVPRL